jgi:hypothetical protein
MIAERWTDRIAAFFYIVVNWRIRSRAAQPLEIRRINKGKLKLMNNLVAECAKISMMTFKGLTLATG